MSDDDSYDGDAFGDFGDQFDESDEEEQETEDTDDDEDEEDDEDEDEEISTTLKKIKIGSYQAVVVKNIKQLEDHLHTSHNIYIDFDIPAKYTAPFLTRFEKSKLLQKRVEMIDSGKIITVDSQGITDSISLALLELEKHICPLIVRRLRSNKEERYYFFSVNAKNEYGDYIYTPDFI